MCKLKKNKESKIKTKNKNLYVKKFKIVCNIKNKIKGVDYLNK